MKKSAKLPEQMRKDAQFSISELAALSGVYESRLAASEHAALWAAKEELRLSHAKLQEAILTLEELLFSRAKAQKAELTVADPAADASAIERFFSTRFQEMEKVAEMERRDKRLVQAREHRELAAAQMDEDWLGMKALAYLRDTPHSPTELAEKLGEPIDAVAPILARLVRFDALEVQNRKFVCTEKGLDLLRNLETATGISLVP